MTNLFDGKTLSQKIQNELKTRVDYLIDNSIRPGLGVILVGDNIESKTYVEKKQKSCIELGIKSELWSFPEEVNELTIIERIEKMNQDKLIHGILVQLPLPDHLNTDKILNRIDSNKDVDGLNTINMGRLLQNKDILFTPCTPRGCIELLDHYNISIKEKNITIIGSSNLVGLPLSIMLLHRGATVTLCNINTVDIKEHINHAEILFTCCGVPHLVKGEWIKEGTIIVDIGINKVIDTSKKSGYRLVGDVEFESAKGRAKYITPVPGGVGPMTVSMLMKQIIESTERFQLKSKI